MKDIRQLAAGKIETMESAQTLSYRAASANMKKELIASGRYPLDKSLAEFRNS